MVCFRRLLCTELSLSMQQARPQRVRIGDPFVEHMEELQLVSTAHIAPAFIFCQPRPFEDTFLKLCDLEKWNPPPPIY